MKISAHMVVKNEEKWVWFAIMSIIDYVDELIIFDTGSTDKTVQIIKTIQNSKIIFKSLNTDINGPIHTLARKKMFEMKKYDWVLIVDGDEIWTEKSAKEMVATIMNEGNKNEFLIRPYLNMVGDVFHYQDESAGQYKIGDYFGHITIRCINTKIIPGLHIDNPYPLEGFYDNSNTSIQDRKPMKAKLMKHPFLHMTHLRRSDSAVNDNKVFRRQNKYKYELGHALLNNFEYPKCFFLPRPNIVPSPWQPRNLGYILNASWQTPLKFIKRRL